MKRAKVFVRAIALVLACCLMFTVANVDALAAIPFKTTTVSKKYKYDPDEKVLAKGSYKKVKVKGSSKAAKKINNSLTAEVDEFKDAWKELKSMAREDYAEYGDDSGSHFPYEVSLTMAKTASTSKILSVRCEAYAYIGGVHGNYGIYGKTYSRNTGKELDLDDVVKGDAKAVKKKVVKAFKKMYNQDPDLYWTDSIDTVKSYKVSKYDFYVKGKYAYVCFQPYELAPYAAGPIYVKLRTKY